MEATLDLQLVTVAMKGSPCLVTRPGYVWVSVHGLGVSPPAVVSEQSSFCKR